MSLFFSVGRRQKAPAVRRWCPVGVGGDGGSGTGVSFIISLPERARIFIDCCLPPLAPLQRRNDREKSKKADEPEGREREREWKGS